DAGRTYAVNIFEDVTQAKEAELRQRFLARSGQLLASSLDYGATLKRVAELAVPWLADWCAVDLPGAHGQIVPVAPAPADPQQPKRAEAFRARFPPDPESPRGVAAVLNGGAAQLYPRVPVRLLDRVADPERREAMREIGISAAMIVPMRVGEETLGAITL